MASSGSKLNNCTASVLNHAWYRKEEVFIVIYTINALGVITNAATFILFLISYVKYTHHINNPVSLSATGLLLLNDCCYLIARLVNDFLKKADDTLTNYILTFILPNILVRLFHATSDFISLAFSFMRFYSLHNPPKAKVVITPRNFLIYMCCVVCFILAYNITWMSLITHSFVCFHDNKLLKGVSSDDTTVIRPFAFRLGKIILFHVLPGLLMTIFICVFLFSFYRLSKHPPPAVQEDEDLHNMEKRFMQAHLMMAVKCLILNNTPYILRSFAFPDHVLHKLPRAVLRLILDSHFATTWLLVIFVVPSFQENIVNLFKKAFSPSVAKDLTLLQSQDAADSKKSLSSN